jgi:hypothetical protein
MRSWWLLGLLLLPTASAAAPTDYRFEAVENTVERGVGVPLQVRAVYAATGQPVPGLDVRTAFVDRSPDGQVGGSHPAFFTPSLDYGIYSFRADLPVDGRWALVFTARIPGEPQPVTASVVFTVVGRLPAPSGTTAATPR